MEEEIYYRNDKDKYRQGFVKENGKKKLKNWREGDFYYLNHGW